MRRTIDIIVSAVALLVLAPLLVIVAAAVSLDSTGNPVYRGWRVGAGGKHFRMWKFRTMVQNADRLGAAVTNSNDPRITRIGRLLRRSKIDELPQFVNVLLGDMTLVGPRPEAPVFVAAYTSDQKAVLQVRPGITGYAQLQAGHEEEQIPAGSGADDYYTRHLLACKIQQDLDYLKTRTFWSDLQIAFSTAGLLLRALRK